MPEWFEQHGANAEMRWSSVSCDDYLTPTERFFVRSQSSTPAISPETWRLRVEGSGLAGPIEIDFDELVSLPRASLVRALECAGNGRRFFSSEHSIAPLGTQWGLGAIGVARWTGVRLKDVLHLAGLDPGARCVMLEGLDEDRVRRPLPLSKALEDDVLLAYAMNGQPLPLDHGAPVRAIVPGWVAAASIKWVGRIVVSKRPLWSRWNTELYVLSGGKHRRRAGGFGQPLDIQVGKSALELAWGAQLSRGFRWMRGRAWSPHGRVERVEVSIDARDEWRPARLIPPNLSRAWVRFEFGWDPPPGEHLVRVRATDELGNTQPESVGWNDHGYLYGGILAHPVLVR